MYSQLYYNLILKITQFQLYFLKTSKKEALKTVKTEPLFNSF